MRNFFSETCVVSKNFKNFLQHHTKTLQKKYFLLKNFMKLRKIYKIFLLTTIFFNILQKNFRKKKFLK